MGFRGQGIRSATILFFKPFFMTQEKEDEFQKAISTALRVLGLCDRSRRDLDQRLARKGYSPEVISRVLDRMESMGYLDDRRYAYRFAVDAVRIKNRGPYSIRYDLQQRGIGREIIDETILRVFEDHDMVDAARRALRKKYPDLPIPKNEIRRVSEYLRRKGFSYDIIKVAIKENEEGDEI